MKQLTAAVLFAVVTAAPAFAVTLPIITKCPPDAVLVGQTCVDKYEASVWQVPATSLGGRSNTGLINKIRKGTVKLADLTAGGATQISPSSSCTPAIPSTFPLNGQWTAPVYAVSIAGVHPTACVSWFQADQACALSGKRLLTNAEWQRAAAGTPDPGTDNGTTDCNISAAGDATDTGARSSCKSSWGAFDMVGNLYEWVSDWVPLSTTCPGWGSGFFFNGDFQCFAGADTSSVGGGPGALMRGGDFDNGSDAGVFAIRGSLQPSGSDQFLGFRCGR
jgi:formylglycine-generating enzyme required for sulfatase activity